MRPRPQFHHERAVRLGPPRRVSVHKPVERTVLRPRNRRGTDDFHPLPSRRALVDGVRFRTQNAHGSFRGGSRPNGSPRGVSAMCRAERGGGAPPEGASLFRFGAVGRRRQPRQTADCAPKHPRRRPVPRSGPGRIQPPGDLPGDRRGGFRPHERRVSESAGFVSAPHAHHVFRVPKHRPRVPVSGRGPSLPGETGARHVRHMPQRRTRPFAAGKHVRDKIGRFGRIDPAAFPGERPVGPHEFQKRDFHIADGHPESPFRRLPPEMPEPQRSEVVREGGRARFVQQAHEGYVQRKDERVPQGDASPVAVVEIGRTVPLEGDGGVQKAFFGRDQPPVEGQGGQKRLQCGAGRTGRERRIDLPVLRPEIVPAARERQNRPVRHAQNDGGGGVPARRGRLVDRRFAGGLDIRLEGGSDIAVRDARLLHEPIAVERRLEGTGRAADFGEDGPRRGDLPGGRPAQFPQAAQHVIAAFEGAFQVAVRAEARRRLHHARQKRGFPQSKRLRGLAEPPLRGGLYAHEIGPERRTVQVLGENPDLVLRALHLQRHDRLAYLPKERLRVGFDEPHRLHGQGGGARNAPSVEEILPRRPQNGERPHPAMRPKRAVLDGYERTDNPIGRVGRVIGTAIRVVRP